jgi:RNA polymerase sigma-70 factor (ECF subfamily)
MSANDVELLSRARAGDEAAFARLVDPFRRELQVHCYRILGSTQDAEDALQETLLAAWRGLERFEERATLRTWLYRISTNRSLNALRAADRRQPAGEKPPGWPQGTPTSEPFWLQPYPDALLGEVPDSSLGPEARYEMRESISLAFVTALQLLPPRQRAVLVLRDVLGFAASEVAAILDTTEESVTSALKRARATLENRLEGEDREKAPLPGSPEERRIIGALTTALEANDVGAIVELLSEDVRLRMPPLPFEYIGREAAGRLFEAVSVEGTRRYRLAHTRANGQPAFGLYLRDPGEPCFRAVGLLVATLSGHEVAALTRFDLGTFPLFGLPRTLPEADGQRSASGNPGLRD